MINPGIQRLAQPLPKTLYSGINHFNKPNSNATVALSSDHSSVTITSDGAQAVIHISSNLVFDPEFHADTAVGNVLVIWSSGVGGWTFPRTTVLSDGVTEYDPYAPDAAGQIEGLVDIKYARSPDGKMYDDLIEVVLIPSRRSFYTSWKNAFVGPLLTPFGVSIMGYDDHAVELGLNNFEIISPFILIFVMAFPVLIIAVCPSEWRKAKVQWIHLLRIGVIALAPAIILNILPLIVYSWNDVAYAIWSARGGLTFIPGRPGANYIDTPMWLQSLAMDSSLFLTLGVIVLWAPIYFWFALRRGMELRRPILLWIFACAISWLGTFTVLTVVLRRL